jgi:hypothetical protein
MIVQSFNLRQRHTNAQMFVLALQPAIGINMLPAVIFMLTSSFRLQILHKSF